MEILLAHKILESLPHFVVLQSLLRKLQKRKPVTDDDESTTKKREQTQTKSDDDYYKHSELYLLALQLLSTP